MAKSTYADIQLESLLSPLPIMALLNVREQLNYEFYINNNNLENGIYYIYYSGIGYPKGPDSSQGVGLTYGPSVKNIHGYDA